MFHCLSHARFPEQSTRGCLRTLISCSWKYPAVRLHSISLAFTEIQVQEMRCVAHCSPDSKSKMLTKFHWVISFATYPQQDILGSTFLFLPIFLSTYHFHLSGNRTPVSDWNKRFVRSFASLNFFSHSGHERTLGKPIQRNFPSNDWREEPSGA